MISSLLGILPKRTRTGRTTAISAMCGIGSRWSRTDWTVVLSFSLIAAAVALYCLLYYCCPHTVSGDSGDPQSQSTHLIDADSPTEPSRPPRSSPAGCGSSRWQPCSNLEGSSQFPGGENRHSESERERRRRAQLTAFFIDIPNEQFLHEVRPSTSVLGV